MVMELWAEDMSYSKGVADGLLMASVRLEVETSL